MAMKLKEGVVCFLALILIASVTQAELKHHWQLEGDLTDIVGALTLEKGSDGPVFGAGNQRGMAAEFDGVDDYLFTPLPPFLPSQSISVWIKTESVGSVLGWSNGHPTHTVQDRNIYINADGTVTFRIFAGGNVLATSTIPVNDGQWHHVAAGYTEGGQMWLYVDGLFQNSADSSNIWANYATPHFTLGIESMVATYMASSIDDLRIYDHALDETEIAALTKGAVGLATLVYPDSEAVDVLRDSTLVWEPGKFAVAHNVYFGPSFDDVNAADTDNPLGVLVSEGQDGKTFDPGRLDFGQTYFWRIDEVNGMPDYTVFRGDVWSFTVELMAYPVTSITAIASSTHTADMGPEKTIDGSGLDDLDGHGVVAADMWLAGESDTEPWIQYEFAKAQKLKEMLIWNSNQPIETLIGFGCKFVTIETSMDGSVWEELADVPEFAQAPGVDGYAYNTTVAFGGVTAQYVKLTVNSGHGDVSQFGLSEVRFLAIPVYAQDPQPATGAALDSVDVTLSWRPGREAATHEVVLSADRAAVEAGTAIVGNSMDSSFLSTGLTYDTEYFWRINEVNGVAETPHYESEIWSFTTPAFLVIDDLEMYEDKEFLEIWAFWADGYEDDSNGAIVGNGSIGERAIVHQGSQSMPIRYTNSGTSISEVTLPIDGRDWTANGLKTLSLAFYGVTGNTGQLYVKINDTQIPYDGDDGDIAVALWQTWNIDLSTVGDAAAHVSSLTIGVEGANATGTLYIDTIRLYPTAGEMIVPVEPDAAKLSAHYTFDDAADLGADATGNNRGTVHGDAGQSSQAMVGAGALQLDGDGDFIQVGGSEFFSTLDDDGDGFTIAAWVHIPQQDGAVMRIFSTDKSTGWAGDGWGMGITQDSGNVPVQLLFTTYGIKDFYSRDVSGALAYDTWVHVAAVFTPEGVHSFVNGLLADTVPGTLAMHNATSGFIIGGLALPGIEQWFNGLIDDLRIYDTSLPAAQVAGLAGRTTPMHKPF